MTAPATQGGHNKHGSEGCWFILKERKMQSSEIGRLIGTGTSQYG